MLNKNNIIIILALICVFFISGYYHQLKEKQRYENNFNVLNGDIKYLKTTSGQIYAKTGVLELKYSELTDSLKMQLRQFKIKPRNINTVITNILTDSNVYYGYVKDSIINDTVKVQAFNYSDTWTDIRFIKQNDSVQLSYFAEIPIDQFIFKKRTWKFWKRKVFEQVITSKNPNIKVNYSSVLKVN